MKRYFGWGLIAVVLLVLAACSQTAPRQELALASDGSITWTGQGSDSERCVEPGEQDPRFPFHDAGEGWMHWVLTQPGTSSNHKLTINGTDVYDPGAPFQANVVHFYTPFYNLDGLTAVVTIDGSLGNNPQFVISDYCPGEPADGEEVLNVEKEANTSFKRTHSWDIDKRVETEEEHEHNDLPKIWLYTDGSGDETATWTVDVGYEDYTDSDFLVFGTITITNPDTNKQSFTITSVMDHIGDGNDFAADCPEDLPHTLEPGDVLVCEYEVSVNKKEDAEEGGVNAASVYVEGLEFPYLAFDTWEFDFDNPTTELYKTVNIEDISDLFGTEHLGTVTAPNGATFTYDKHFAWEDYEECGDYAYDNEATIVETGQSAAATLLVNVQCLIFKGETATGEGPQWRPTTRAPKNWFMYTTKENLIDVDGARIIAGQHHYIGDVFGTNGTGMTLNFELVEGWELADVSSAVKVHPMSCATGQNYVQPGKFRYHFDTLEAAEASTFPKTDCYGIHLDVGRWVPDPGFGP